MIEILNGIKETIQYEDVSKLRMYHNIDYEDYPQHWHVGIEVIMPINNWYEVIVGHDCHHLDEDEIIFINSGVIHSLKAPPTGERIILQFDLSLLYNLKEFDTTLFMLPPALKLTKDTHPDIYRQILSQMKSIITEYDGENALKEAAIYSSLIQIYVTLCRKEVYDQEKFSNANTSKQHEYIEKLLQTCDYINKNFSENLTLDDVAEKAGFSKFHFTRLFKQFTNMTFHNYLNQRRIMKAETLLMDTNLSILEVALNSGFNSTSTFNRIFKNAKNCSPNEFRKQRLNNGMDVYDEYYT